MKSTSIFHIPSGDDLYEVALNGLTITRISRYAGGTSHRQDMQYDDLTVKVQDAILEKIVEIIKKSSD